MSNQLQRQWGFSLIEVLTVVSVAAIVSLIAVPSATSFRDQYRLTGAANQLGFDIARARMQAIGQNMYLRVRFPDSSHYREERSSDGVTYVQDGSTTTLPSGMIATVGGSGGPSFNRLGIATAATTITLQNTQGYRAVQTNVLGRVTVTKVSGP